MKVKVRDAAQENFIGFANHARRRPGDVFVIPDQPRRDLFPGERRMLGNEEMQAVYDAIKDAEGKVPQQFSFRWMEPVEAATPEKHTTAQQSLDRRSETIKLEKAQAKELAESGGAQNQDVL